jgi:hypothetical protein
LAGIVPEYLMKQKAIPVLAALLILGSAVAWYLWPRIAPSPALPPQVPAPLPAEEAPVIANPLPPQATMQGTPALPALVDSDGPFAAALLQVPGAAAIRGLLVPERLIRRIVATIDNLPRHRLAIEMRPLQATVGTFLADGDELHATIDAGNAARYAPAIAVLRVVDLKGLIVLYRDYYPLFQRAYEDLGYPHGYFNDRLVTVIDDLLATPQSTAPVDLVRPNVFWQFADPELEARSAGQRLLLRIGADNGAVVRARLRELRALVAKSPAATATATPTPK